MRAFGVPPAEFEQAMLASLLDLRGWASMFSYMETHPAEAPHPRVRLLEFAAVQSILTRSSVEALARRAGWDPSDMLLSEWLGRIKPIRPQRLSPQEPEHTSALAFANHAAQRREGLEQDFERNFLAAIYPAETRPVAGQRPSLQLYTCIDDRHCSIRRHTESLDPVNTETFGIAGFFGLPIRYRPADGGDEAVLAPPGQRPPAVLEERGGDMRRRRVFAHLAEAYEWAAFTPLFSLALSMLAPLWVAQLWMMGATPGPLSRLHTRAKQLLLPRPRTDFDSPFTPEQAAPLLAQVFTGIGTAQRFAPLVVVLGHGASSTNNPFAAAYNCGACGGREGGPNARLFARLANSPEVRRLLQQQHNIAIPDDTVFVGGLHNTTTDQLTIFDEDRIPPTHHAHFARARAMLDKALGENALERCHRFLLADHVRTPQQALREVQRRALDAAEVRPELNHANNAAVVVGRRELTKGRFFDRRVFFASYDPSANDDTGAVLENVLAPALIVGSGINLEYLFSTVSAERHGAGTKSPMNLVGGCVGVMQGTAGDLHTGLPSQMTEMHTPVRALYVVDAPLPRVETVLNRRPDLKQLVVNDWVRFFVRDPDSGQLYRGGGGSEGFTAVDMAEVAVGSRQAARAAAAPPVGQTTAPSTPARFESDSFREQRRHGSKVARREQLVFQAAAAGMVLSCAVPLLAHGAEAMNPFGPEVAVCATALALPVLAFSRRYLHGERMFGRFALLSSGLVLGFNLVALAPSLEQVLAGWSLFGLSSTFLIGSYSDRPTVRSNALFAFSTYRISDFALLSALAFSSPAAVAAGHGDAALAGGSLLLAALLKSSQFPLSGLFARSMEGPTPTSALGYAGLSAHIGVVLLAGTMPLWFDSDALRAAMAAVGAYTAVHGTLVANIRADRKGALAYATSSTLGCIFITLALGYPELALLLSLGHTAFRIKDVLRANHTIAQGQELRAALGAAPWPKEVPDWLYRLAWRAHRIDADMPFIHSLQWLSGRLTIGAGGQLTRPQQWAASAVGVILAGFPYTPLVQGLDEVVVELLPEHPWVAANVIASHFIVSVLAVRYMFAHVLARRRVHTD